MAFGENVKRLRIMRNMTQDELADASGTTKASISNYERNKRFPQYPTAEAIATALDVPVSELYTKNTDRSIKKDITTPRCIKDMRERKLKRLMTAFDKLSDKGQNELVKRAEELVCIPKYTTQ